MRPAHIHFQVTGIRDRLVTPAELEQHFRSVAQATGLPIMLYNNPPAYRVNIDLGTLGRLAGQEVGAERPAPRVLHVRHGGRLLLGHVPVGGGR